jgi:hypothetical protein
LNHQTLLQFTISASPRRPKAQISIKITRTETIHKSPTSLIRVRDSPMTFNRIRPAVYIPDYRCNDIFLSFRRTRVVII